MWIENFQVCILRILILTRCILPEHQPLTNICLFRIIPAYELFGGWWEHYLCRSPGLPKACYPLPLEPSKNITKKPQNRSFELWKILQQPFLVTVSAIHNRSNLTAEVHGGETLSWDNAIYLKQSCPTSALVEWAHRGLVAKCWHLNSHNKEGFLSPNPKTSFVNSRLFLCENPGLKDHAALDYGADWYGNS